MRGVRRAACGGSGRLKGNGEVLAAHRGSLLVLFVLPPTQSSRIVVKKSAYPSKMPRIALHLEKVSEDLDSSFYLLGDTRDMMLVLVDRRNLPLS